MSKNEITNKVQAQSCAQLKPFCDALPAQYHYNSLQNHASQECAKALKKCEKSSEPTSTKSETAPTSHSTKEETSEVHTKSSAELNALSFSVLNTHAVNTAVDLGTKLAACNAKVSNLNADLHHHMDLLISHKLYTTACCLEGDTLKCRPLFPIDKVTCDAICAGESTKMIKYLGSNNSAWHSDYANC